MAHEIIRDPVYKQVTEALVELIRTEFAVGDQFLTERQISERFGISRTTANKALSNLVIDGVLEFRKGVGTFVRPPRPTVNLRRLVSFTAKALAAGLEPETRVRRFRRQAVGRMRALPAAEVAAVLALADDAEVYLMERVRSLNGRRVVYERRALREDLCPELVKHDVAGSLYSVLHDRYGLELDGVAQRIRARTVSAKEAEVLETTRGDAVLELTGAGYLTDGTALWYEQTLYRGDAYEFVNQVHIAGDETQATLATRMAPAEEGRLWYHWPREATS